MKWIIRIVGLLVVMLLVAVVSLLLLPADRIAKIATDQLRSITGRDVTISGDVEMTFWPVLGVSAGGLEVGSADWAEQGPMLTAAKAAIGVDALSLLRGDIRIKNIEAQSPVIRLEQRGDGRGSWEFTEMGEAPVETSVAPANEARTISIERLNVTNATLIYSAEGATPIAYSGIDLSIDWPEQAGSASINATVRPAGERVQLAATIERFEQFLAREVRPISAEITASGGWITLDGRASLAGAVAGEVNIKMSDTAQFLAALGLAGVDLPDGFGRTADIRTDLTLTPDRRLALRETVADLGGTTLRGAADIKLQGTPQVNAQIIAGALDLSRISSGGDTGAGTSGGASGTASSGTAGNGWPKTAIDASALSAFNGEIGLRADSIDLGAVKLGATRALLRNDRSRMVFELRGVAAYEGALSGEFVMNNRNGLSVGGKLNARRMAMKPLLTDLADLDRFSGTGDADLAFLGVGQSLDEIMRSLNGSGAVNVWRGAIEGIDLDQIMGNFDVEGGTTVFDSLGATFDIENGVLRNNDLLMLLPNFTATGEGEVGLGAQTIDYTLTPKALRVNGDRGLAVPVRIFGPWADPQIKPDLQAALDLNFAKEQERAKEKLNEKLVEELGIVREDGQSVEDAVQDEIEDKLKKELFKLFD